MAALIFVPRQFVNHSKGSLLLLIPNLLLQYDRHHFQCFLLPRLIHLIIIPIRKYKLSPLHSIFEFDAQNLTIDLRLNVF
jgi:hypothetical protein